MIASFLASAPDTSSLDQQVINLTRYREAYTKETRPHVRDSIRQEVLHAIPDMRVGQEHGEQQVQLWDDCCPLWDVVEVSEVDAVTPNVTDTSYCPTKDTMYLTSNALPGYGGTDVYYSPYHFYPQIKEFRWLAPYNIGQEVNTSADEFGLRWEDTTLTFYRNTNNVAHKYRAIPRIVIQDVVIDYTCASTNFIYLNVLDCRNAFIGSYVCEDEWSTSLPSTATTLHFRCCNNASPRTFTRCTVRTSTLTLRETDIRTHECSSDGIHNSKRGELVFGFSVHEDQASATAAFQSVVSHIVGNNPPTHVRIERAPNHLTQQLNELLNILSARKIHVEVVASTEPRTTIALQMD